MTEKAAELVRLLEAELDLIESGAYECSRLSREWLIRRAFG